MGSTIGSSSNPSSASSSAAPLHLPLPHTQSGCSLLQARARSIGHDSCGRRARQEERQRGRRQNCSSCCGTCRHVPAAGSVTWRPKPAKRVEHAMLQMEEHRKSLAANRAASVAHAERNASLLLAEQLAEFKELTTQDKAVANVRIDMERKARALKAEEEKRTHRQEQEREEAAAAAATAASSPSSAHIIPVSSPAKLHLSLEPSSYLSSQSVIDTFSPTTKSRLGGGGVASSTGASRSQPPDSSFISPSHSVVSTAGVNLSPMTRSHAQQGHMGLFASPQSLPATPQHALDQSMDFDSATSSHDLLTLTGSGHSALSSPAARSHPSVSVISEANESTSSHASASQRLAGSPGALVLPSGSSPPSPLPTHPACSPLPMGPSSMVMQL